MSVCAYLSCFPELRGSPVVPPSGGGARLDDCQDSLVFPAFGWLVFFHIDRLSSIKVKSSQPSVKLVFHEPGDAAVISGDVRGTPPDYPAIPSPRHPSIIPPFQLLRQLASLLCRSSSLRSHLLGRKGGGEENVFRMTPRGSGGRGGGTSWLPVIAAQSSNGSQLQKYSL